MQMIPSANPDDIPPSPDMILAAEFVQSVPFTSIPQLMREVRDTLLAMDEPERLIRGLSYLVAEDALREAEQSLGQALEEAASAVKAGCRDTARRWAKWLVGNSLCKLVLGEQYSLVSGGSWRMYQVLRNSPPAAGS